MMLKLLHVSMTPQTLGACRRAHFAVRSVTRHYLQRTLASRALRAINTVARAGHSTVCRALCVFCLLYTPLHDVFSDNEDHNTTNTTGHQYLDCKYTFSRTGISFFLIGKK